MDEPVSAAAPHVGEPLPATSLRRVEHLAALMRLRGIGPRGAIEVASKLEDLDRLAHASATDSRHPPPTAPPGNVRIQPVAVGHHTTRRPLESTAAIVAHRPGSSGLMPSASFGSYPAGRLSQSAKQAMAQVQRFGRPTRRNQCRNTLLVANRRPVGGE